MAPKKRDTDKKKTAKKPGGAVINYRGKYPFKGKVAANGKVYCTPCRATGKNHRGIKNAQRDIASHISTKHKENSAYNRDQKEQPGKTYGCACGYKSRTWNPFLRHIASEHGFRGKSSAIKAREHFDVDRFNEEQDDQDEEQEDIKQEPDDSMEEFDELPDRHYKDEDKDGGRGPGGASNHLLQAAV
ncbi:hypothetical protein PG994_008954 [Apiospora phragmitis]|uniref:Uncharacterized protein n=1 Tax=Apiospora phragmitis TaxID=2905665 RepID=A0ABR1UK95_9PEZI